MAYGLMSDVRQGLVNSNTGNMGSISNDRRSGLPNKGDFVSGILGSLGDFASQNPALMTGVLGGLFAGAYTGDTMQGIGYGISTAGRAYELEDARKQLVQKMALERLKIDQDQQKIGILSKEAEIKQQQAGYDRARALSQLISSGVTPQTAARYIETPSENLETAVPQITPYQRAELAQEAALAKNKLGLDRLLGLGQLDVEWAKLSLEKTKESTSSTGSKGKNFKDFNNFNNALVALDELETSFKDVAGTRVPALNYLINQGKGATGDVGVKKFNTAAALATSAIIKASQDGKISDSDYRIAMKNITPDINSSFDQKKASLKTVKSILNKIISTESGTYVATNTNKQFKTTSKFNIQKVR